MKLVLICLIILVAIEINGQEKKDSLTISGYSEIYYSYDFTKPSSSTRPAFLYNYNRHNEFNINLAYVKANYTAERVRGNIALAAGTYSNANYAAEPGVLKNVMEANAGYKISRDRSLWFDVGIMPSHIGFESAVGKENWTLTRSLVAENSPYFESGAKISYTTKNNQLMVAALALNGWQRITRVEGNSLMSWGTQVYFKPSPKLTLNYSTFFGTDKPDSARLWRQYHHFYAVVAVNDKLGITGGFDIGKEKRNTWYSPVVVVRYSPKSDWAFAYRSEFFKDKRGVIIATGTPHGFATFGQSLNVDYSPADHILFRIEGRLLSSKDDIFDKRSGTVNTNTSLTFSTAVYF
jgi:hypothetical protein